MSAWYQEWFGADYLELYAHRDSEEAEEHVAFVVGLMADRRPRSILDLACGAGRHTEALRRRGLPAFGVDLSLTLLAEAAAWPRARGDMRCLPFGGGAFDWVLNFFTSFGYFPSERENFRVLEEIVRVLAPGGRFLIDFLNRDHALARLEPRALVVAGGRELEIERWFDPAAQRFNKRIVVREPGKAPRSYLESVRAYRQEEVEIGLQWAGLRVTAVYGNFQGDAVSPEHERLILVGEKPRS